MYVEQLALFNAKKYEQKKKKPITISLDYLLPRVNKAIAKRLEERGGIRG